MVDLQGDWEVGLVEIQYPHKWFIVPKENADCTFSLNCRLDGVEHNHRFTIAEGCYSSVETMLEQI